LEGLSAGYDRARPQPAGLDFVSLAPHRLALATTRDFNGAQVGTGPAAPTVEAGTSGEAVVAAAAEEQIVASLSVEDIVTASAENLVVALPSADEVVPAAPLNPVITTARNDDVVTRGADELIRPARPDDRRLKPPAHRGTRRRARSRSDRHREHRNCERDDGFAPRQPVPH
jgi:hypothetical protein